MRTALPIWIAFIWAGYLAGGRLKRLADWKFKLGWLALVGLALQAIPFTGATGDGLVWALLGSLVLLLVVAAANWRTHGMRLVFAGLLMNFIVISLNWGMPVERNALERSNQGHLIEELAEGTDPKHHLAFEGDDLLFLADVIPFGAPINQVVSLGDLVMYFGVGWVVAEAMVRRRTRDRSARPATASGRSP